MYKSVATRDNHIEQPRKYSADKKKVFEIKVHLLRIFYVIVNFCKQLCMVVKCRFNLILL